MSDRRVDTDLSAASVFSRALIDATSVTWLVTPIAAVVPLVANLIQGDTQAGSLAGEVGQWITRCGRGWEKFI